MPEPSSPLVSIVIPCYNGAQFLPQAIESCLSQTYRALEVIVVDDAGADSSAEIAESFARRDARMRVIRRSRNGGISAALNSGYEISRGDFLTRLAQDDWFRDDAIAYMVGAFDRYPEAGLVYCNMQIVDEEGRPVHPLIMEEPKRALLPADRVGLCVMWRRSVWEKVGGFEPACDTAEDYDYWLRVSRCFPIRKCGDESPFFFRYHKQQGSVTMERRQKAATRRALLRYWLAEWRSRPVAPRVWVAVGKAFFHWLKAKAYAGG